MAAQVVDPIDLHDILSRLGLKLTLAYSGTTGNVYVVLSTVKTNEQLGWENVTKDYMDIRDAEAARKIGEVIGEALGRSDVKKKR